MPRTIRPHAPGSPFHITARTQGRVAWFTEPLRTTIEEYICEAAATSTTRLLAYAVMPNHLHIIVRQGVQPLGWMMQRVLQRTALLVRRAHNHRDHVFGRRYWSGLCDDASYLRQVITYTHLNPYYAGLCQHPREYKWTSHSAYEGCADLSPGDERVCVEHGRRLFASSSTDDACMRGDYMRFIEYWMRREKLPLGAKYVFAEHEVIAAPQTQNGDMFWSVEYGDVVAERTSYTRTSLDLRDRAVAALRVLANDLSLEQLRMGGRTKAISKVRRQLIAILLSNGYRNGAIARCLNISTGLVSAVAATMRSPTPMTISTSDAHNILRQVR